MNDKKKRFIYVFIAVLLAVCIPFTVFAVINAQKPQKSTGTFEQKIVNRVNFGIENTDFTFKKQGSGNATYVASFTFTAQKTEADFYAMINSLTVSGITPDYIIYTSDKQNNGVYMLDSVILPTNNGEPTVLKWTADIYFTVSDTCSLTPEVIINYTSGMTKQTANTYDLYVPLKVIVN